MARKRVKKEPKSNKIIKNTIITILILFVVFFCGERIWWFLKHAEIFTIKDIQKEPSLQFVRSQTLDQIMGENIFSVDLRSIQRRLQRQFPEVDKLRVSRKFPDTICLSARKREPFAVLMSHQHEILLDEDGYVLSFDTLPSSRYPVIQGFSGQTKFVLGRPLRGEAIHLALKIIAEIRAQDPAFDWPLSQIDISNLSQITLLFSNDLTIIFDREHVPQKVQTLAVLLHQGKLDYQNINYIDLRLKDPIISYVKQK